MQPAQLVFIEMSLLQNVIPDEFTKEYQPLSSLHSVIYK
jgi:hypothetical protein